mmetsp:Transcript_59004/g.182957  ORF Transcript_59004/g.182957 Transcript_59004/m.182957 type:complete len:349 (+) Transcript_59004:220-1266(+)
MQLYERGLWRLDDEVSKFIPSFAAVPGVAKGKGKDLEPLARPIVMRDILTHTSGISYSVLPVLRDGRPNPMARKLAKAEKAETLAEVIDAAAAVPLVHQPGETWSYSMGIDVAGRVVEVLSGMPLDEYFEKHIFGPLGMTSTCFTQRITPEIQARQVQCYSANIMAVMQDAKGFYKEDFQGERMQRMPNDALQRGPALVPGGGLVSTLDDWMALIECLCGGGLCRDGSRLLQPETIELMAQNHLPENCAAGPQVSLINGRRREEQGYGFGLGVAVAPDPLGGAAASSGLFEWGGLTSTIFWVDLRHRLAVVCFTQLLPSSVYALRTELKELLYGHLGTAVPGQQRSRL